MPLPIILLSVKPKDENPEGSLTRISIQKLGTHLSIQQVEQMVIERLGPTKVETSLFEIFTEKNVF